MIRGVRLLCALHPVLFRTPFPARFFKGFPALLSLPVLLASILLPWPGAALGAEAAAPKTAKPEATQLEAAKSQTSGPLASGPEIGPPRDYAPTEAVRIIARRPHDPAAFTQGFLQRQGVGYESTGLYGHSSVRRVDPATGRVLASRLLPAKYFGEGLDLCGPQNAQRLVQLTWREGVLFTYAPATLAPLGAHPLRGEGWGLACHGREAVLSDGTDTLRILDARTLDETGRSIRVRDGGAPVVRLNELEWVNGWLAASIWQEDRVAIIRPQDGRVALWLDLSPLRRALGNRDRGAEAANGVAFDPTGDNGRGVLLLTGKRWDSVFAVALPELLRHPPRAAAGPGKGE